ncbi:MAG TPA: hypothetical protein VNX40_13830 [Mucilaginibacter sp.]|jgi:hypothetical protein|nr:hypothetical protein [Mucilaginibacter sp.]
MKNLLFLIALVAFSLTAFCQTADTNSKLKLDAELRNKLTVIDEYVKSIDADNHLTADTIYSEYTNGGNGEDFSFYADSLRKIVVKRITKSINVDKPTATVIYYKNNMIVYKKDLPINFDKTMILKETYYENDKVLYNGVVNR